jgi:hypothetical protein
VQNELTVLVFHLNQLATCLALILHELLSSGIVMPVVQL